MSEEPKQFDEVIKPNTDSINKTRASLPSSESGQFKLIESPSFNKFRSDLSDAQIQAVRDLAPKREFTIDINGQPKNFTRRKIKSRDYADCERIRAKMIRELDTEKQTEYQLELYEKWALYYLDMSKEDYDNADFEDLKRILDTCNIVTVQGVPNS